MAVQAECWHRGNATVTLPRPPAELNVASRGSTEVHWPVGRPLGHRQGDACDLDSEPEREALEVLGATEQETRRIRCRMRRMIVIQLTVLAAVQEHPVGVVTAAAKFPPAAPTVAWWG